VYCDQKVIMHLGLQSLNLYLNFVFNQFDKLIN